MVHPATDLIVIVACWDTTIWSNASVVLLATALIETSNECVFVIHVDDGVCTVIDAGIASVDQRECLRGGTGAAVFDAAIPGIFRGLEALAFAVQVIGAAS